MRVTLDARTAGFPGIGRFITGLWRGLVTEGVDVVGLWPASGARQWLGAHAPAAAGPHVPLRARAFLPAEQVTLPRTIRRERATVHHAPHFNVPYFTRAPIVLTVHDLIPYFDPGTARSRLAGEYYRRLLPLAIRRATVVVAVSPFTARQLHDAFGLGPDRVRVIEAGIDRGNWRPRDEHERADVARRYALPSTYLLYVGTAKPHKNLATLFAGHGPEHPPLVLAGPTADELAAAGTPLARDGRVITLGRVPDAVLPALYSGARALVLPSLLEGYGLTPIEAMACGTAAIVSDGGALPETVGDAGVVVPATDPERWHKELTRVCEDDDLRDRLVAAGFAHADAHDWRGCARRYVAAYRDAAAAGA